MLTIGFFQYGFHKRAMTWLTSLTQNLTPEEQKKRADELKQKRDAVLAGLQALKSDKKDNRPAQLRAPKSNFGWVLFDEPTDKKKDPSIPQQIPTTMQGSIGQAAVAQATEDEQEEPIQKGVETLDTPITQPEVAQSLPAAEPVPTQVEEDVPTQDTKELAKPETLKADLSKKSTPVKELDPESKPGMTSVSSNKEPAPSNPLPTSPVKDSSQSKNVAQRIADIKALHEKLATFKEAKTEQAPTIQQQRGSVHVRGANSIGQKPKRNIIALTKGFVEKMYGEEGTDLVDRDGDPDKQPSLEELKYLSYESKLNWCLQSSWKQNFSYQRMRESFEGNATIEFTLDEHGNLTNCTLLQSTGYHELDTMVMRNMKVASPFPPIPKHFGTKTYTTGRVIQVRSNNFGI